MDINTFYKVLGVDFNDVLKRLGSETLIKKYLLKFRHDESFSSLEQSLREKNFTEAFRAAHTLKGICLNLELKPLTDASVELTEILRDYKPGKEEKLEQVYCSFTEAYKNVIEALQQLQ